MNRTIAVSHGRLKRLMGAVGTLIDEAESSADFGDVQGRGTQDEAEALNAADDALTAMRDHIAGGHDVVAALAKANDVALVILAHVPDKDRSRVMQDLINRGLSLETIPNYIDQFKAIADA
jgi:hypothetical protein